jgi:predicted nucleotidyltransferase
MPATASSNSQGARTRQIVLRHELDRIERTLVEEYDPLCVILYGSTAKGEVHEWSDLDFCVIKQTSKSFYERLEEVIRCAMPRVGCHIVVYTPDEWDKARQQNHWFVLGEIMAFGKVLYERGETYGCQLDGVRAARLGRGEPAAESGRSVA